MPHEHASAAVLRRELFRQGRSWLLAVVCVAAGGFTVWRTDSVLAGAVAAVATAVVLAAPRLGPRTPQDEATRRRYRDAAGRCNGFMAPINSGSTGSRAMCRTATGITQNSIAAPGARAEARAARRTLRRGRRQRSRMCCRNGLRPATDIARNRPAPSPTGGSSDHLRRADHFVVGGGASGSSSARSSMPSGGVVCAGRWAANQSGGDDDQKRRDRDQTDGQPWAQ